MADVLAQNTSIFIKSYGRGTLATASFRGTAPSHTQVQWNGMAVNSPMLGMVDFSLIPSYFIDNATVYHGAGSVGVTGGGLGGAITLQTEAPKQRGFNLNFIQGSAVSTRTTNSPPEPTVQTGSRPQHASASSPRTTTSNTVISTRSARTTSSTHRAQQELRISGLAPDAGVFL